MSERRNRVSWHRDKPESATRLAISVEEHAGYAVVTVAGEVDVITSSQLRDPLHDLIDRGLRHHVVDLRAVPFLDSTGLGVLVGDHKRVRDRGGSLQVVCGPGLVLRVFRLTGVDRIVPVRESVEE